MPVPLMRIAFSKTGAAKYIAHLDLNRAFIRCMNRAGLPLEHSMGFNPHPKIVFATPLSLGIESFAELTDIRLAAEIAPDAVKAALIREAPGGIVIKEVYRPARDFKEIAYSVYRIFVESTGASADDLRRLFSGPVMLEKKSKSRSFVTDIMADVRRVDVSDGEPGELVIDAVLPSGGDVFLNPDYIVRAVRTVAEVTDSRVIKRGILTKDDDIGLIREMI